MRVVRVVAMAALVVVAVAAPAGAQPSVVAVGWWSRSPIAGAPEGGVAVGAAPDGPVTVAAVLLDLGDHGVTAASLTAVEVGGVAQGLASLRVCPVAPGWPPAAGAPLEQAPQPACEGGSTDFLRDGPSSTWGADLSPLLDGKTGLFALMVVPAAGGAPLYEVRLARPALTAVPDPAVAASAVDAKAVEPADVFASVPAEELDANAEPLALGPLPEPDGAPLEALAEEPGEVLGRFPAVEEPGTGGSPAAVPTPLREQPGRAGRALAFTAIAAGAGIVGGVGRRLGRARRIERPSGSFGAFWL